MQTSPEARVALATNRSAPARFGATTRASNEPLGARVTRVTRAMRLPFWKSTTFQRTPLRFWSAAS